MKTLKTVILLIAVIALYKPVSAQTETKSQLVIPLSEPGKAFQLDVSLLRGSIEVDGYDGKDIIVDITAEASKPKAPAAEAGGMKLIGSGSNAITATEKSNRVVISGNPMTRGGNLKIRVPKAAGKLKISTVNSGGIIANDISGDIEVNNVNGAIKMTGVTGSVVANTTNGNINVSFKSVDANAAMAFSTFNGVVDVTLPATFKANIKLHTDRGEIYSDFDANTVNSAPSATKAKDGSYRYGDAEWITGKIGGGGPELMMKTYNGNIYIRKAK